MTIIGPQSTHPVIDASAVRNLQSTAPVLGQAISRNNASIAIAQIVLICALPILIPLIPTLLECTFRIAAAPFLALHHIVVLNYTLFKHHPPHFISTVIKANLLFWKGFILDQFLPHNTARCSMIRNCRAITRDAYAQMIFFIEFGDDINAFNIFERERLRDVAGIQFPSIFSTQLDLTETNRERMQMFFNYPPAILSFNTSFRPSQVPGNLPSAQLSQNPSNLPPARPPQVPGNLPSARLSQFRFDMRPRINDKLINPAHYRIHSEPLVIPQSPAINLFDTYAEFWSICEGTWPENFAIQDDSSRATKEQLAIRLNQVFTTLQDLPRYNQLTEESTQLIKNVFGHIFHNFKERNQQIEQMPSGAQKRNALNNLQRDLRLFFQRVGIAFNHCNDRTVTTAIEFYSQYILRKPLDPEARENANLEQHLLKRLQEFRRDQFQAGYHHVDTDMHDAATERYAKVHLNNEFGLGYPAAIGAADNFATYAMPQKVAEIRAEFLKLYTPKAILDHVKQLAKSDNLYMKIVNWFETQNPPRRAADIYDIDKGEFNDSALMQLLERLHVIQ
jgi:hypothetical protein